MENKMWKLTNENSFTVGGVGRSVSKLGDVNGDGINDFAITDNLASPLNRTNAGISYILYGDHNFLTNFNIANLTKEHGCQIIGAKSGDQSGTSIDGVGDFNGDGIGDFVIGAPYATFFGNVGKGISYLIYGNKDFPLSLDLGILTYNQTSKFVSVDNSLSGSSVSAAGDINGDGLKDILIGAPFFASNKNNITTGSAYVIYGTEEKSIMQILGYFKPSVGFGIIGTNYNTTINSKTGVSLSGIGDFNGDKIDDFIIGAPNSYIPSKDIYGGMSYIIYGKKGGLPNINLQTFNSTQGIKIEGANANQQSGYSLSYAGDFNRDGYQDVVIGTSSSCAYSQNVVYIVFGSDKLNRTIDLNHLEKSDGLRIFFSPLPDYKNDYCNYQVSGVKDFNKDGFDDIMLGIFSNYSSKSFLVLGRNAPADINIQYDTLTFDTSHQSNFISGAGDINNDTYYDIISSNGNEAHVTYGSSIESTTPSEYILAAEIIMGSVAGLMVCCCIGKLTKYHYDHQHSHGYEVIN